MAMRNTIKPYKLKASGEVISRDDLNTWKHILLGLSGKMMIGHSSSGKSHGTNGLVAPPADTQLETVTTNRKLRAHFKDFLTCVATYALQGFGETILRESTSFR